MEKELYQKIHNLVYNYKTKNKEGFISSEQKELLKLFPSINIDKYNKALNHVTCMMDNETNEFIIYHCDIENALICGIEDRDLNIAEWD